MDGWGGPIVWRRVHIGKRAQLGRSCSFYNNGILIEDMGSPDRHRRRLALVCGNTGCDWIGYVNKDVSCKNTEYVRNSNVLYLRKDMVVREYNRGVSVHDQSQIFD